MPTTEINLGPKWSKLAGGSVTQCMDKFYRIRGGARDLRARLKRWRNEANTETLNECTSPLLVPEYRKGKTLPQEKLRPRAKNDWQTGCSSIRNLAETIEAHAPHLGGIITRVYDGWEIRTERLDEAIKWADDKCKEIAREERKTRNADWRQRFAQGTEKAERAIFKHVKTPYTAPASTLYDKQNQRYTSNVERMHQCLHEEWQGVLDQHKNRGDTWDAFSAENSQFFPDLPRMDNVTLTGDILYEAIQSTDPGTAAGSDGWKPGELRWLPKKAWDLRAKIANARLDGKGTPESYEHAYMTAIPKKGKDPKPLNQRMLTIFTAHLYSPIPRRNEGNVHANQAGFHEQAAPRPLRRGCGQGGAGGRLGCATGH